MTGRPQIPPCGRLCTPCGRNDQHDGVCLLAAVGNDQHCHFERSAKKIFWHSKIPHFVRDDRRLGFLPAVGFALPAVGMTSAALHSPRTARPGSPRLHSRTPSRHGHKIRLYFLETAIAALILAATNVRWPRSKHLAAHREYLARHYAAGRFRTFRTPRAENRRSHPGARAPNRTRKWLAGLTTIHSSRLESPRMKSSTGFRLCGPAMFPNEWVPNAAVAMSDPAV